MTRQNLFRILTVPLITKSLNLIPIRSRCLLTKEIKKCEYLKNRNKRFFSSSDGNVDLSKASDVVIPKASRASISESDKVNKLDMIHNKFFY